MLLYHIEACDMTDLKHHITFWSSLLLIKNKQDSASLAKSFFFFH